MYELEALRPTVRGAADFTSLVRVLRHADALEQARVALQTAERCRRVVRSNADGVPVPTCCARSRAAASASTRRAGRAAAVGRYCMMPGIRRLKRGMSALKTPPSASCIS